MARVLRNPLAGAIDGVLAGSWTTSSGAMAFHRRLPGYHATPLVAAPRLAARLGVGQVLVKDESNRYGLPAFKMLGASWAAYRLLTSRLGRAPAWATIDDLAAAFAPLRPLELVTATDGNHGRAVARVGRMFGLGARVFVAEGTAPVRIAAIESEGAIVEEVAGDYDTAVARSASVAAAAGPRALLVSDTSWEGYVDGPRHVIEGYDTIFAEIDGAVGAGLVPAPDLVVIPVGVGALAAAAVVHYRLAPLVRPGRGPVLVAVEPGDADCVLRSVEAGERTTVPGPHHSMMVGLNCGTPSLVAWPLIRAGLDWCVTVEDERAAEAMRWLADEGIVSGETGAAALAGLAALVEAGAAATSLGPDSTVLVLSTEGATDEAHYDELVGRASSEVARAGHGCN
jgi:diaminopropionate ammonia-lyase